jgi:hypothetical protein
MNSSSDNLIIKDELIPLIRERLDAGFKVRYLPFCGVSMLPLLRQGIDAVEIGPLPEKLKKYDLPVYRRASDGKYIMHRVVGVKEDHYVCLGDNTYIYEHILPEQMLGVVTTIKRGDKLIPVTSQLYRLYSRVWYAIYPLRKAWRSLKQWLRRLLK